MTHHDPHHQQQPPIPGQPQPIPVQAANPGHAPHPPGPPATAGAGGVPIYRQPLPVGLAGVVVGVTLGMFLGIGVGGAAQPAEGPRVDASAVARREAAVSQREKQVSDRENSLAAATTPPTTAPTTAAPATTKPAPPPPPPPPTIEDGVWTVGVDMPPGKYRVTEPVASDCYWAIYKSGSNGADIIQNDIPGGGRPTVMLKKGQDFGTQGCGTWKKIG